MKRERGEVLAVGIAMERAVQIRARVRDHLDLADVELRPRGVVRPRRFTREVVGNDRAPASPCR